MAINVEDYYKRYGPMVLRRCRYLLKDEEEALDVMQDVFVKLIRNEKKLEDKNPSSLLLTIATNESLNRIRSKKRRPEDANDDLIQRIACVGDSEGQISAKALLDKIFGREKESTRTIAVLHLLDGFTLEETAKHVGLSVSGVRKRLRLLKNHVKELQEVAV